MPSKISRYTAWPVFWVLALLLLRLDAHAAEDDGPRAKHGVHAEKMAILQTVQSWARAWSARDVDQYFSYYSDAFQTPAGKARAQWAAERRARIRNKAYIELTLMAPHILMRGNTAAVTFDQVYSSDRVDDFSRKTLMMVRDGKDWKIIQERSD
jgi:colicin import membrane protein